MVSIRDFIKENYIIVGLTFAILIGVILRLKGLTYQSYWLDELASIGFSNPENSFKEVYRKTVGDVHPPLYQALLWVWFHIFGFSELAGRCLSAVIGSFSIYAVYLLGKELFDKQVGLYASIIASMNQFLIYYAQMVRSYSLLFLFSTLSCLYLIKVLKGHGKQDFILYLIFSVALAYTHYFGLFLIAAQFFIFILYFITEKKKRKPLMISAAITAIVLLVSLVPLFKYISGHAGMSSFWIELPANDFLKSYFVYYFTPQLLSIIYFMLLLAGAISLFLKRTSSRRKMAVAFLAIWIFIGVLLPYLRSVIAVPLLTERNAIIVLPALMVLISYGISLLVDYRKRYAILIMIVILGVYQLYHMDYYSKITKQQWREVLYEVTKTKGDFPAYELVFNGGFYKNYATMLDIDMEIHTPAEFVTQYKTKSLPNCFWILESHGEWISGFEEFNDKSILQVTEIQKHEARAVLYTNGVEIATCKNIDHSEIE